MKASSALALTGLGFKELPKLLKEIDVETSWQSISKQNKQFMETGDADDLLSQDQAEKLIAVLENPQTELQKKASRLFNEVAPLFRGFKTEQAPSFSDLPKAEVSSGDDWMNELFNSDGGPVRYNRSAFENENAGVVEVEV